MKPFLPTTRRGCARRANSFEENAGARGHRWPLANGGTHSRGSGISALIPLIKAGFVDWIISTGANLYHDTHFGIGLSMHQGNATTSDVVLREEEVVRIYDIFFDYSVLLDTDAFFRKIIEAAEFQRPMSTAEFHYLCGRYVYEREQKLGIKEKSLLAVAYEYAVPVYTSSPGDSSIGMNVAAKALQGNKLAFDPSLDVNETAAIVLAAKRGKVNPKQGKKKETKRIVGSLYSWWWFTKKLSASNGTADPGSARYQ